MRVAIVHERLDVVGGAEKVVLALHQLYPEAPVYTSFVDYSRLTEAFRDIDIRPSYMQRLPAFVKRYNDKLLPFYTFAFQDFDFSEYDLVLSSSYLAAKSVLTPSSTCHISYCHTPMRFAWDMYPAYIRGGRNPLMKVGLRALLQYFRLWDAQTAQDVDYFIANSETVRRRIRKRYRRDAVVIPPPVQTRRFQVGSKDEIGDYYLVVSRLVQYKRIDLAIRACRELNRPLIIIGTGREQKRLESMAGPNVKFLGWQSDETVARYLSKARALLFPGEEDFGILPVEAQAAGTPVIAYGQGGALETVVHGKTGVFFGEQSTESLVSAILQFEECSFDRRQIAAHASQFDDALFRSRIDSYIKQCCARFKANLQAGASLPFDMTDEEDIPLDMETHVAMPSAVERTRVG